MRKLLEGCTILLLCSERITFEVMTASLADCGGKAIVARQLGDLPQMVQTHTPDVIVAELRLAGGSGLEVLSRLRQLDGFASIPVLITAPEDVADRRLCIRRALQQGAADIIFKPFDEMSLVLKLRLLMLLRGCSQDPDEPVRRWIATVQPMIESIRTLTRQALDGALGGDLSPELVEVFETIGLHCDQLLEGRPTNPL